MTVPRAIFFDWDGVLCSEKFWHHLPEEHPIRQQGQALFTHQDLIDQWMINQTSAEQLIRSQYPLQAEMMLFELNKSCQLITVRQDVLDCAERVRSQVKLLAVATDNMDCLAETLQGRSELSCFDEIISSHSQKVLKRDPTNFFAPTLAEYNVSVNQALLIDDSLSNCLAFERFGGDYIHFSTVEELNNQLRELYSNNRS